MEREYGRCCDAADSKVYAALVRWRINNYCVVLAFDEALKSDVFADAARVFLGVEIK